MELGSVGVRPTILPPEKVIVLKELPLANLLRHVLISLSRKRRRISS